MTSDGDGDGHAGSVVRLLPTFRLALGSEAVLGGPAQRLVAFLAVHPVAVERAYVAGRLTPELDDRRASANLRTVLWRLSGVAPHLVVADGSSLALAADVAVDLHEMTRRAREVLAVGHDVDELDDGAVADLIDGLSTDVLDGWYDEWLLTHQARWRQLRMHALEALSDHLRVRGRYAYAHQAALVAAEIEPLRESPQRCMVRAHLDEGNVSEAVRVFAAFRQRLERELGVEPSPILAQMMSIVRGA